MQLGMLGLGRMGANMARRLIRGGHDCVVFDRSPDAVEAAVSTLLRGRRTAIHFVGLRASLPAGYQE